MFMDIRLLLNSFPSQDVPIEWLWLKADVFVLHMSWILYSCRNSPARSTVVVLAAATLFEPDVGGEHWSCPCLGFVRIFRRILSVVRFGIFEEAVCYRFFRPGIDDKEQSGLSVSLSADAWVQIQIVKFWEYDQIQKGSWFNDQAKQTELLLLSKSQSQNYCENIIGNTTLPFELWHLDDLKDESSFYSGQGWKDTNM